MVSFIENPESYDSQVMVQHLDKQLEECMALEKKLSAFDKQLSLEPRYIHRVRKCSTEILLSHTTNSSRYSMQRWSRLRNPS